jgi:hypothetical protein
MGHAADPGPLSPRQSASPDLAHALADLQAYQRTLRERGDLLQARAVARCIELVRKHARRGPPN